MHVNSIQITCFFHMEVNDSLTLRSESFVNISSEINKFYLPKALVTCPVWFIKSNKYKLLMRSTV